MYHLTPEGTDQHGQSCRVLVVEDEALVSLLISDQLEELGHSIVGPAFSLAEAQKLASAAIVDVGLIDWNLRGESAEKVIDILAGRNIPCVIVTGYTGFPNGRYANIAVLTKPFLTKDLQRAIERTLQS